MKLKELFEKEKIIFKQNNIFLSIFEQQKNSFLTNLKNWITRTKIVPVTFMQLYHIELYYDEKVIAYTITKTNIDILIYIDHVPIDEAYVQIDLKFKTRKPEFFTIPQEQKQILKFQTIIEPKEYKQYELYCLVQKI